MRLIDADKLIESIRQHHYMLADKFNSQDWGMFTIGIEEAINLQLTAYDVDKVVEELEKYGDKFSSENYDDWYAAGVVSDCEEIVKRGGVDE